MHSGLSQPDACHLSPLTFSSILLLGGGWWWWEWYVCHIPTFLISCVSSQLLWLVSYYGEWSLSVILEFHQNLGRSWRLTFSIHPSNQYFLTGYVSLFGLLWQNTTDEVSHKQQKSISQSFGGFEVPKARQQHCCVLVRTLFLIHCQHLLTLPSHDERDWGILWGLFY